MPRSAWILDLSVLLQIFANLPLWLHAPMLLEVDKCLPAPQENTLLLSWRGMSLTRALPQIPRLQFADSVSLSLQMHWACMVPAEKLNIAHADAHAGNVVLLKAPNDGDFIIRINFRLRSDSALGRLVDLSPAPEGSLTLHTRFLLCLIDWARVEAANMWLDFPSAIGLSSPRSRRPSSTSTQRARFREENESSSFYNAGLTVSKLWGNLAAAGVRLPTHGAEDISITQLIRWLQSGSGGSGWCTTLLKLRRYSSIGVQTKLSDTLLTLMNNPSRGYNFSFRDFDITETVEWRGTPIGPVVTRAAASADSLINEQNINELRKRKRKEPLPPQPAPDLGPTRSVGRPRKWATSNDRLRACRARKNAKPAAEALTTLDAQPKFPSPAIDIFGAIYDTPYVSINRSQSCPAGFAILGVFVAISVPAETVLTSVDDALGLFPVPNCGIGSLVRFSDSNNVVRRGTSIVASREITAGEELFLPLE